jgi:signal transduction histidine kinase
MELAPEASPSELAGHDTTPIRVTRRVLAVFGIVDLGFKLLVPVAYAFVVLDHASIGASRATDLLVALAAAATVALHLGLFGAIAPVDRWMDGAPSPTPDAIRRAAARLHSFPLIAAGLWMAAWLGLFASHALLAGVPLASPALLLFLAAMALGPPPLGYLMATFAIAPTLRDLSRLGTGHDAAPAGQPHRVRTQAVLLCLSIGLAPSLYVASVAFSARVDVVAISTLAIAMTATFAAVVVFSVLVAHLFAESVTVPVTSMTAVMKAVAQQGDVQHIVRLPVERRDEIGELAEWMNVTIDRLKRSELDRLMMRRSWERLNRTLEMRVEERTARLAQVNESLACEMQARMKVESELLQAQKLESVGRLAAGVAHEINTPIQFVSDSVHFLREATEDMFRLVARLCELDEPSCDDERHATARAAVDEALAEADFAYLTENVPAALVRVTEGLDRVATIVRSMKEFAHPDRTEMHVADLNRAIESTLTIARNEYKYVADVETELGELPPVPCFLGELNQVVLNIIVNAAHAISDSVRGTEARGMIRVRTWSEEGHVVVTISDTGGGIPEHVRAKVFDPFFTTKDVGKGTGQGLAIARAVVVDKHHGSLTFETETGKGTTFSIRLPLDRASAEGGASHGKL